MKRHLTQLTAVASLISLPFAFAQAAPAQVSGNLKSQVKISHAQASGVLIADAQAAETQTSGALISNIEAPASGTLTTNAHIVVRATGAETAGINYLQLSYNLTNNTNLSPQAVQMAFAGYQWAIKTTKVKNKDILTIVDFSVPSYKNRLYVINLKTGDILMALPVTHGKNSGRGAWTTSFSNQPNSLQSSIGVFLTKSTYFGKHGYSLRIKGLESSNSNVESRDVVVHAANYASRAFIKSNGFAGTSWGCFAVDPSQTKQLISYIKDGSVMYAYGQSEKYLASTKILSAPAA